jgi:hypothetical protein
LSDPAVPFRSGAEAWWWYCASLRARADGAIQRAGLADELRPCEPVDVIMALDRLRRGGRLRREHLKTLFHWGALQMPPPRHKGRDQDLWHDALRALEQELQSRGVVERQSTSA